MPKTEYIKVEGTEEGIDFASHYRIGKLAVAYYLLGWKAVYEPVMCFAAANENGGLEEDGSLTQDIEVESGEFELVPDRNYVVAVMVGDDRRHIVDISDLKKIEEDAFCRSCGQIGCRCNVWAE